MKQEKVVVTGYYGYGNLGDEALRDAVVSGLGAVGFEPLVLAGKDRFRPLRLFRFLRAGAALILGGGGLLQNATSSRSLYYYLGLITAARRMGRPVFLIGQGLGPIAGRGARAATRRVLSRVAYLGVRDRASRALAARLGLGAVLDGDLFFLNPPAPASGPRPGPRIGVALSGGSIGKRSEDWRRLLAALSSGHEPVFIPFFPREDLKPTLRLAAGIPGARVEVPNSAAEAQAMIGGLELLISTRLHPLEFALRAGVRMIGVGNNPKIIGFTAEVSACGGPEIPCVEFPDLGDVSALLEGPAPQDRFAAAYAVLHRRTKAGFDRFLSALAERIGGKDG